MNSKEPDPIEPGSGASDGFVFELSGGHVALDFANTLSRREDPASSNEYVTHFGRLVTWSEQAGLITVQHAEQLREAAAKKPRAAAAALRRALAVREAVFSIFVAAARGERAPAGDLAALNAALPLALAALQVSPERGGYAWRFTHDDGDLTPMLGPVVRAAADLLTSPDLARVRECNSDVCFWLFLDRSKNGTRRWCDMKVCGNRAKARRHYHKERSKKRPRARRLI